MVGRNIHQYQFTEKLGAGGMGEIYKAHDTRLNRTVAIKVLPAARSGDPERRQRFLQEAQAASGLNHPSIITIHDVLSEGDTEFMVMEYVAGKTLNDAIPKGGLRVPQALKYALQMADALNAAHNAGIVHRDLKPANVMVTEAGLVKILDFGLAKLTDRTPVSLDDKTQTIAHVAPLTIEGSILGTVSYMSPEQAQGRKVDTRSDIFSFGAVVYEMLTGRRAFEGDSSLSTLSAILRDEVKPMAEVAPDVPPPLETLLQRCLRKEPEDRWQSMREVQIALSALKRDSDSGSLYTTRVASPKAVAVERKPADNDKKMAVVVAIASVVVLAGSAAVFFARRHAAPRVVQAPVEIAAPAPVVEPPAPEPAPPEPAAAPGGALNDTLNNDGVLAMIKENVPTQVILGQIRSSKTNFDLSTAEVIRLTKGGVPANVIEVMRNPKRAPEPSAPASASVKQSTPARPEPAPAVANAPLPAAEPAVPAPVAVATAPPTVPPPPVATPQTTNVVVSDAMPFTIELTADVPADADIGRPLRFTAVQDFRVRGVLVIPKGAAVTGQISETAKKKKFLGIVGGGKLSFELLKADTAGGQPISVRALSVRRTDGATQRPVETGTRTGSKDIVAAQGAQYIAYVDGEQSVTVPQK
jgi:predicted Ser/Thr protein kinase